MQRPEQKSPHAKAVGAYERNAETLAQTVPDFLCDGCGYGVFGKLPVFCPKCNGMAFSPTPKRPTESKGIVSELELLRDRALNIMAMERQGGREKSQRHRAMRKIECIANRELASLFITDMRGGGKK